VSAAHYKAVLGDDIDLYSGDDSVLLAFMGVARSASCRSPRTGPLESSCSWSRASNEATGPGRERSTNDSRRVTPSSPATRIRIHASKAALRYLGINVGQCRLPHSESDDTLDADAAKVVAALQASRG